MIGIGIGLSPSFATNWAVRAPYPAPAGYRWAYVIENNKRAYEGGQAAVMLERIAA